LPLVSALSGARSGGSRALAGLVCAGANAIANAALSVLYTFEA